jgi:hypothetical protein
MSENTKYLVVRNLSELRSRERRVVLQAAFPRTIPIVSEGHNLPEGAKGRGLLLEYGSDGMRAQGGRFGLADPCVHSDPLLKGPEPGRFHRPGSA